MISDTTEGLKYFNIKGCELLNQCAKLQEKDKECTDMLLKLNDKISRFENILTKDDD